MSTRNIDTGAFGVSIEEMSIAEYDGVYTLLHSTPGIRLSSAESREMMERHLARNPGMSFVARFRNRIVGCAMSGHDGRRGYLYHLAVAPDFRRRGIASGLVACCLEKLAEAGIDNTHIQVVVENDLAHKFWSDRGWHRRADIITYSFTTGSNPNVSRRKGLDCLISSVAAEARRHVCTQEEGEASQIGATVIIDDA